MISSDAQATLDYLNKLGEQYEAETDEFAKLAIFNKMVYWSIELDIELAYDRIFGADRPGAPTELRHLKVTWTCSQ